MLWVGNTVCVYVCVCGLCVQMCVCVCVRVYETPGVSVC